jgi:hypothetical protein
MSALSYICQFIACSIVHVHVVVARRLWAIATGLDSPQRQVAIAGVNIQLVCLMDVKQSAVAKPKGP